MVAIFSGVIPAIGFTHAAGIISKPTGNAVKLAIVR